MVTPQLAFKDLEDFQKFFENLANKIYSTGQQGTVSSSEIVKVFEQIHANTQQILQKDGGKQENRRVGKVDLTEISEVCAEILSIQKCQIEFLDREEEKDASSNSLIFEILLKLQTAVNSSLASAESKETIIANVESVHVKNDANINQKFISLALAYSNFEKKWRGERCINKIQELNDQLLQKQSLLIIHLLDGGFIYDVIKMKNLIIIS